MQAFAGHLDDIDFTHHIHEIQFGHYYSGIQSPLRDYVKERSSAENFFQYYLKVVPTKIYYLNQTELDTNQYSVTQYQKAHAAGESSKSVMPGLYIHCHEH
jgi:hypothetical protein